MEIRAVVVGSPFEGWLARASKGPGGVCALASKFDRKSPFATFMPARCPQHASTYKHRVTRSQYDNDGAQVTGGILTMNTRSRESARDIACAHVTREMPTTSTHSREPTRANHSFHVSAEALVIKTCSRETTRDNDGASTREHDSARGAVRSDLRIHVQEKHS